MQIAIDPIDDFFNLNAGFAQEAVWKPAGSGDGKAIAVIFDRDGINLTLGDVAVNMTTPTALCRAVDVNDAAPNTSVLVVGGDNWNVINREPQGENLIMLRLSRD